MQEKYIEMPLEIYCKLKDISRKTAYNMRNRGEIELTKQNSKSFVLVPESSIFILNSQNDTIKTLQKRRDKKLKENLSRIVKELEETIFLLNAQYKSN